MIDLFPTSATIERAWAEYRGWARRARELQQSSRRWKTAALCCAVLVAILGAAASQAPAGSFLDRILLFLAGAVAALTPVLGRELLEVKSEANWIRARGVAEAIKSECYRYGAGTTDYRSDDRTAIFEARIDALSSTALDNGLTPLENPATVPDERMPFVGFDEQWYLQHRLREQRDAYYGPGQRVHEKAASKLRIIAFSTSLCAALLGVAGSTLGIEWTAPWIGVLSTLGATIVAYGLMDRRLYLAQSYGAMTVRLSHMEAHEEWDLQTLVTATEDLLQSQHAAWTDRMEKSIAPPAAVQS